MDDFQKKALSFKKRDFNTVYIALGLVSEAGELGNFVKKEYRDGVTYRNEILDELGDVMWYAAVLADKYDVTLKEICDRNVKKLKLRHGLE